MGLRVANWVLLVSQVLSEDARLVTHARQPCQPASTQLPRMSALSDCLGIMASEHHHLQLEKTLIQK